MQMYIFHDGKMFFFQWIVFKGDIVWWTMILRCVAKTVTIRYDKLWRKLWHNGLGIRETKKYRKILVCR